MLWKKTEEQQVDFRRWINCSSTYESKYLQSDSPLTFHGSPLLKPVPDPREVQAVHKLLEGT